MKPSSTLDTPILRYWDWQRDVPECLEHGCRFAVRNQGAVIHFVHDGLGRYSMTPISEDDLADIRVDIWGDQVKPWIERLHQEGAA